MQPVLDPKCLSRRISSKQSFNFPSLEKMCTACPAPNPMCHPREESSHLFYHQLRPLCALLGCTSGIKPSDTAQTQADSELLVF